jgi:hypothetical protein
MSRPSRAGWSAEEIPLVDPGHVRPSMLRGARARRGVVVLAHRPTITGLEQLPDGPFLLESLFTAEPGRSEDEVLRAALARVERAVQSLVTPPEPPR